jgi:glucose/arabinose dehydrogenase
VLEGAPRVDDVQVIWRMTPTLDSTLHFGGRLVFARDGNLFVTTGERSILPGRRQAQRLDGTLGKVVRIRPDGTIPDDDPFVGRAGARPEIWSIGHRNIQSAALHPGTGALWTVEHGARGGDELNHPERGKDYGWPTITYGVEYSGKPIGEGLTARAGMEQPVYYWDPVIAPSGALFYTGDAFPDWKGDFFVGSMQPGGLVRLKIENGKVTKENRYIGNPKQRVRDIQQGSDGLLYIITDSPQGEIIRLDRK